LWKYLQSASKLLTTCQMKKIVLFVLVLASIGLAYAYMKRLIPSVNKVANAVSIKATATIDENTRANQQALFLQKAANIKAYVAGKNYNQQKCILINLGLHSGQKRLAVVNLQKDSIEQMAMVAHGSGGQFFAEEAKFSNVDGSNCSSLGKYKIGAKYKGQFGWAYKMHGLDKTNSNAFARFVVLHSYACVPFEETYPEYICNSQGCAMVSDAYMKTLIKFIDQEDPNMLLYIFAE
jgi:hypothetical protein